MDPIVAFATEPWSAQPSQGQRRTSAGPRRSASCGGQPAPGSPSNAAAPTLPRPTAAGPPAPNRRPAARWSPRRRLARAPRPRPHRPPAPTRRRCTTHGGRPAGPPSKASPRGAPIEGQPARSPRRRPARTLPPRSKISLSTGPASRASRSAHATSYDGPRVEPRGRDGCGERKTRDSIARAGRHPSSRAVVWARCRARVLCWPTPEPPGRFPVSPSRSRSPTSAVTCSSPSASEPEQSRTAPADRSAVDSHPARRPGVRPCASAGGAPAVQAPTSLADGVLRGQRGIWRRERADSVPRGHRR